MFHRSTAKRVLGTIAGTALLGSALTGCWNAASIGIIGGADGPTAVYVTEETDPVKALYELRGTQLGDNSRVVAILDRLPFIEGLTRGKVELQTDTEPYELTVSYSYSGEGWDDSALYYNAGLLFDLIDNLGSVHFMIDGQAYDYYRYDWTMDFGKEQPSNTESLQQFQEHCDRLEELNRVHAYDDAIDATIASDMQVDKKSGVRFAKVLEPGLVVGDYDLEAKAAEMGLDLTPFYEKEFQFVITPIETAVFSSKQPIPTNYLYVITDGVVIYSKELSNEADYQKVLGFLEANMEKGK